MFTITVTEHTDSHDSSIQRYTQTVDRVSIPAVIAAVNAPTPEPPKVKKVRSDKGVSRVKVQPLGM